MKNKSIKESCQSIRESFAFFGYDISDLTDEEIVEGVVVFSNAMKSVGVTTEEAVSAFQIMGSVLNENS